MIQIEINRYTIKKLEEAIEKYNRKEVLTGYRITDYDKFIELLCERYLKDATN